VGYFVVIEGKVSRYFEGVAPTNIPNGNVYRVKEEDYYKVSIEISRALNQKKIEKNSEDFRWENLPDSELKNARKFTEMRLKKELLKLHEKYDLSSYDYACCGLDGLVNRFEQYFKEVDSGKR